MTNPSSKHLPDRVNSKIQPECDGPVHDPLDQGNAQEPYKRSSGLRWLKPGNSPA